MSLPCHSDSCDKDRLEGLEGQREQENQLGVLQVANDGAWAGSSCGGESCCIVDLF